MIKRFLLLALILLALAVPVSAQLGTVPVTFIEGVNIIADLNTNFATAYANALNRTGGTMTGTFTSQAIVPGTTATYDLGSSLVKFRDAFFSRNMDIAGTLNVDGALSDSNSALQINDQLQVTSTTAAQAQIRYDSSNYLEFSITAAGAATINAVGASQGITLSDNLTVNGTITATDFAAISTTGITTTLTSTNPILKWIETDGSADAKRWRMIANVDAFTLQTMNDAESVNNNVFTVARSGATVGNFTFSAPQVLIGSGSITAPGLALSANTKAGLYSTSGGLVLSAQDASAGAGDEAGFAVSATTSGGDVTLAVGNGVSGNTNYRWLSSRFDLTNGNPFIQLGRVAFASLPTPIDSGGAIIYCTDCTVASPCASGGTGALAKRVNGAWVCN